MKNSKASILECLYFSKKYREFDLHLDSISDEDPADIRVASISAFVSDQLEQKDTYPFCRNPLQLVKISHVKDHILEPDIFL